ncbi:sulfuric ester hydrolase [Aureococcus anophagefferens]|nr:sulfuric ester hydrolase [Aureococcus anophagefferens]
MPQTQKLLVDEGALLTNAFVNTPICCPSRTEFLTGRMYHNLGTPGGACMHVDTSFVERADAGLFGLLSAAGYDVGIFGKVTNDQPDILRRIAAARPLPTARRSTTTHDGLKYFRYEAGSEPYEELLNETAPVFGTVYQTSQIGNRTLRWLDGRTRRSSPTPARPTSRRRPRPGTRTPSTTLYHKLEAMGVLDDTYIVYTSDHGYKFGQWRQTTSKTHPYETDAAHPFIVRWPGIAPGSTLPDLVGNVDLLPTVLDLAGLAIPEDVDGSSFAALLGGDAPQAGALIVEYMSVGTYYFDHTSIWSSDASWRMLRVLTEDEDLAYVEYDNSWTWNATELQFYELYDLGDDPYQQRNAYGAATPARRAALHGALAELRVPRRGCAAAAVWPRWASTTWALLLGIQVPAIRAPVPEGRRRRATRRRDSPRRLGAAPARAAPRATAPPPPPPERADYGASRAAGSDKLETGGAIKERFARAPAGYTPYYNTGEGYLSDLTADSSERHWSVHGKTQSLDVIDRTFGARPDQEGEVDLRDSVYANPLKPGERWEAPAKPEPVMAPEPDPSYYREPAVAGDMLGQAKNIFAEATADDAACAPGGACRRRRAARGA